MEDYQKVLRKRIPKKYSVVPFIRLDEAFYTIFVSDSMAEFALSPETLNAERQEISSLLASGSNELPTLLAEMIESGKNRGCVDVEFVGGKIATCIVYSFFGVANSELPYFDCFFVTKDDEDYALKIATAAELEFDLCQKRALDRFDLPIVYSDNGNIVFANKALADRLGCKEAVLHSTKLSQLCTYSFKKKLEKIELNNGAPFYAEFATQDGGVFQANINTVNTENINDAKLSVFIDVAENLENERKMKIFMDAAECSDEYIMIISTDNSGYFWLNKAFAEGTGYNFSNFSNLAVKFDNDENVELILPQIDSNRSWQGFKTFHRADGTSFEAEININKIDYDFYLVRIKDNTRHYGLEKLNHLYHSTDYLTGLSNAVYFGNSLRNRFASAKDENGRLNLMMFSVDVYNDIFFSSTPDIANGVLKLIALRARVFTDSIDKISRLGECRFGLMFDAENEEEIRQFVDRFLKAMDCPLIYNEHEFSIIISASVCSYPDNCSTISELYGFARDALTVAKSSKKTSCGIYKKSGVEVIELEKSGLL